MTEVRLQKVLARAGVCSRRKAEALIEAGRVTVNGDVVQHLGAKVDPRLDRVRLDDQQVAPEPREHWMLHKPRGVLSSVTDPWSRLTARDLVGSSARVFPVGRLDAESSGLVLFTNDGSLAARLTSPAVPVPETCHVLVSGRPDASDLRALRRGVRLGDHRLHPLDVTRLASRPADGGTWLEVRIEDGPARDLRRALGAIGHPIRRNARVAYGPLALDDLPEGTARPVSQSERLALHALAAGSEDDR